MKLLKILRENMLNESPRSMRFIYNEMGVPPDSIDSLKKKYDARMQAIKVAIAKHFPNTTEKEILVYVAYSPEELTRLKASISKTGQLGIWADKMTFIFHEKA